VPKQLRPTFVGQRSLFLIRFSAFNYLLARPDGFPKMSHRINFQIDVILCRCKDTAFPFLFFSLLPLPLSTYSVIHVLIPVPFVDILDYFSEVRPTNDIQPFAALFAFSDQYSPPPTLQTTSLESLIRTSINSYRINDFFDSFLHSLDFFLDFLPLSLRLGPTFFDLF
jgi:hypothetical protein